MIVTRFAPSPTGRLHLGHAYSAVLAHHHARSSGGRFCVRIEDLDPTRARKEFIEAALGDLAWLGLEWDEPLLVQSHRSSHYQKALDELRSNGLVYPCFCTRSDITAALEAPHGREGLYPGTCRGLAVDEEKLSSMPHCWRLDVSKSLALTGYPSWREGNGERISSQALDLGDVILARKDAPSSYHLACVIDDDESDVSCVTRGSDLRFSTPIQRLLQDLLQLSEPTYCHHRLVAHRDGRRLAKRDLAPTLEAMRKSGADGPRLAFDLLHDRLPLGFTFVDV